MNRIVLLMETGRPAVKEAAAWFAAHGDKVYIGVQEMMPLIEMLQASGAMSGNTGEGSGPGFDFTDLLSGMLTPEQQEMFAEYSEMFSHSQQSDQKGDHKDEQ